MTLGVTLGMTLGVTLGLTLGALVASWLCCSIWTVIVWYSLAVLAAAAVIC